MRHYTVEKAAKAERAAKALAEGKTSIEHPSDESDEESEAVDVVLYDTPCGYERCYSCARALEVVRCRLTSG